MKPYLILYNFVSAVGWAYVLFLTIASYLDNNTPGEFWNIVSCPLKIVQTLAVLEIFHSIFRLVPSPLFSTLAQVGSRLLLLWVYTNASVASQNHWSLYLMAFSWSLVEVPRYLFYALNLVMKQVPYPVFFLRYNLFMVLYPSGIASEMLQIWTSLSLLRATSLPLFYLSLFVYLIYLPGAPFLYMHMVGQRKGATLKRNAGSRPAPPVNGIEFPVDKKGERSTTAINQGAFEAAIAVIDKEAAKAVKAERNWRFGYAKHIVRNTELSAQSTEDCLKVAQAGLDYLHNNFEFIRDGKTYKLAEAMKNITAGFETHVIKGSKPKPSKFTYEVPYNNKNLTGDELLKQLDEWVSYGTIEPEARDAIAAVAVKNPDWLDLSDLYFVLLGAGSAMGPLLVLLSLGANVIAVDLDRDFIWKRLIGLARDSCGTIIFPVKKNAEGLSDDEISKIAGCNLFTQTPEIKNWLVGVEPSKPLVIGGYAYLDGALFVKVAMAMDAIIGGVLEKRKDISLGFLCSPTDVFFTPTKARDEMVKNFKSAPTWQKLISSLSSKLLVRNARDLVKSKDGKNEYSIVDGLVVAQGPNYALAKRLQHWRCVLARSQGSVVSTNIAPSTATRSVVHNAQFAAAYGGMRHFKPMEIMYQETSNAVMGAILIHDLRNKSSVSNPSVKLSNPLELFAYGSFHGGIWRMAYKMNSIGAVAAVTYYLKIYKGYLAGFFASVAAVVGYVVVQGPPHTWGIFP